MATETTNYGLKKFESGDAPDLPSLAASMDKIDTKLKQIETNLGLLDISSSVTVNTTDITDVNAYIRSGWVFVSFRFSTATTGWRTNLLTMPSGARPIQPTPASISATSQTSDSDNSIIATMSANGNMAIILSKAPLGVMLISFAYPAS